MRPAHPVRPAPVLPVVLPAVLVVGAYGLGSLLGADLVGRLRGFDPRRAGSGNPGATNVYRTAGAASGAAVLVWDAGKGWVAARLAFWTGSPDAPAVACLCALAVLAGHVYPLWRRGGGGGKGVATFLGVLAALAPPAALVFAAVWTLVFLLGRYVSLASLAAAGAAALAWGWGAEPGRVASVWATALAACALLFWRHRTNLRRLLAGEEHRFAGRGTDGR